MPRTLSRLKFKAPAPPTILRVPKKAPRNPLILEKQTRRQVLQLSKPAHLDLAIAVSTKWKNQPGHKKVKRPYKPHTLRDIVDPKGSAKHGEIIYVFRNTRTNQIIYSLGELLDNYHLEQLPFIGKHSKPPVIRPDEWTPHCVVTFPTPEQGHNAFRKLREFRRLHEISWNKTNPEWRQLKTKERVKRIMDQKANMTADLAEVLRIQGEHGAQMQAYVETNQQLVREFLDKKWPEIDALANAVRAAEREGDKIKWLQGQIRNMESQLKRGHNQNEQDQKRLLTAKTSHENRLKKLLWAVRKAKSFKKVQQALENEAQPANEAGAVERLETLESETSTPEEKKELKRLRKAFAAKSQADARDHYAARSILPPPLKKQLPLPFTLDGVEVKWADIYDAEFAKGKWPEDVQHEQLLLRQERTEVIYLRPDEFQAVVDQEVPEIIAALEARRNAEVEAKTRAAAAARGEPVPELPSEEKTGIWKYVPEIKNPFKRAEA